MLRTGKRSFTPLHLKGPVTPRRGVTGFTLVEVMAATCILVLGVVIIIESFFVSFDIFSRYSAYLRLNPWVNEKIWQAQESLQHQGSFSQAEAAGEFSDQGRRFNYELSCNPISEPDDKHKLFRVDLKVSWKQGKKDMYMTRNAYALYNKEELQ